MNKEDYIKQFYNLTPNKIKELDNEYGDFELHHWQYKELINYIYNLQKQLKKKDKIIDEILNNSFFTENCPLLYDDVDVKNFDCEHCKDTYKKCWIKYYENEVKEKNNGEKKIQKQ